jgi:polyhydroxybutyrate depolymerase
MRAPSRRTTGIAVVVAAAALSAIFGTRAWRKAHPAASRSLAIVTRTRADAAAPPRAPGCNAGHANASRDGTTRTTRSGRTFHVWGPAAYDEARAYPVVVMFHGWSSKGRSLESWFKMEDHVAGAAFTVYPDSKGPSWDFAGTQDLDFTAGVLDALADEWCVDRANVLAFGFSYGARFVHHLGCKRPDLVRAIAAGGGSWDHEVGCVSPMPVLVIHRTADPTMRIAGGRDAAARWAELDGCRGEAEVRDQAHGCTAYLGCSAGGVSFCEDEHTDRSWPAGWNHTVREEYRGLAWRWFEELR